MARLPEAEVTVYTDGAVQDPRKLGAGAAAYTIRGMGVARRGGARVGSRSTSYLAELHAMRLALTELRRWPHDLEGKQVLFFCDSQAAVRALEARGAKKGQLAQFVTKDLEHLSRDAGCRVMVQWIPGHAGIAGNEEADRLAGETLERGQPREEAVGLELANRCLELAVWDKWHANQNPDTAGIPPGHRWAKMVGEGSKKRGPIADPSLRRRHQRIIAQLRANKSPVLNASVARWAKKPQLAPCTHCGAAEEDAEHLMTCTETAKAREQCFGRKDPPLSVLYKEQRKVIEYLQRLGKVKGESAVRTQQ
eukprot:Hpha_TRINITY_DN8853_c0_g3::TRINITY_DN8853_c0_g3_i1::g.141506::m.141506